VSLQQKWGFDMSSISLFHQILILTEDKGSATLKDIEPLGDKRQTLGALGRLEGLHYIERQKKSNNDSFILTDKGDALLASIIESIPLNGHNWDRKWRIILFDIPESQRTVRQMFRLKLLDFGARMLQSSVWISPYPSVTGKFSQIIEAYNFSHAVHFFEAVAVGTNDIDVTNLWHLDDLAKQYKELFGSFTKTYTKLSRSKDPSFEAKCMIISLGLLMRKDPYLPPEYMPSQWIGYKALIWYQKIRPFCR
jgi:phenylacetic acid degradation operon negative regulatory protein